MAIIFKYLMKYQESDGSYQEAEIEVDCKQFIASSEESVLDEQARRYLIGKIIEDGGRVINIKKV